MKAWLTERPLVWIDSTAFATVADRDSTDEVSGSIAIDHLGGKAPSPLSSFFATRST